MESQPCQIRGKWDLRWKTDGRRQASSPPSLKFHGTFIGKQMLLARDWTSGIRLITSSAPKLLPLLQLINNIFITLLYQCMSRGREGEKDPAWSRWRRGIHYIIIYYILYIICIHSPRHMPKQPLKNILSVVLTKSTHITCPDRTFSSFLIVAEGMVKASKWEQDRTWYAVERLDP